MATLPGIFGSVGIVAFAFFGCCNKAKNAHLSVYKSEASLDSAPTNSVLSSAVPP